MSAITEFLTNAQAYISSARESLAGPIEISEYAPVTLGDGTVVHPSDVHLYNLANNGLSENSVVPSGPEAFDHLFEGQRGRELMRFMNMPDDFFETQVENPLQTDHRFVHNGQSVYGTSSSLDLIAAGFPTAVYRQTGYFHTDAVPGDGIIVMDFWIAEQNSGGFLAGDGRGYVDPMNSELGLDRSRMTVTIDRESGRGMVMVSPTTVSVNDVPASIDSFLNDSIFQRGNQYSDLVTVPARPIVFGPNPGVTSGMHNNYFQIESDESSISIDYDAVNSVTSPIHVISVDGPLNIEKGEDGLFQLASTSSPDAYPSIAVVQYLPDGTQNVVYTQENEPVIPGALPLPD